MDLDVGVTRVEDDERVSRYAGDRKDDGRRVRSVRESRVPETWTTTRETTVTKTYVQSEGVEEVQQRVDSGRGTSKETGGG